MDSDSDEDVLTHRRVARELLEASGLKQLNGDWEVASKLRRYGLALLRGTRITTSVARSLLNAATPWSAFTFINNGWDGQPHCYLKSSTDTRKQVVGAVSATVSSSRSTNTTGGHIQAQFRSGTVHPKVVEDGYSRNTGLPGNLLYSGQEKGIAAFEQHRKTWITEADIKEIADTGVLNTVRVPVGHWIIRDATTAPVNTLTREARTASSTVPPPVTLGTVGSQTNIDNSIKFATFLAARYKNSPAFLGMALMKEPVPPVDGNALQHYYIEAYKQIRATGNDCILLVTPFLCDQDPDHLKGMIGAPQYTNVWNEIHAYFIWGYEGKTEEQVLAAIDQYDQSHLKSAPTNNRLFLGEWYMGGSPDSRGGPLLPRAGTKITCLLQHRYYGRLGILDVATLG
ncbi:hypothetical protein PI125_g7549 [Phytophthora idaei]|nr:hypothetical protein PI125_g7549 [Phytophthora idaei]KAG3153872.1 hypothetical protein PI126_g9875 [Phytophthora idaei]